MIERKRRNDFVRKREFDMLRKVRREGLSGEQLAALGGSSRIDDSEPRTTETPARQDAGVKAKIDEIEQQMVGDGYPSTQRRAPEFYNAPTQPAPLDFSKLKPAANAVAARWPGRGLRPGDAAGRRSGAAPRRPQHLRRRRAQRRRRRSGSRCRRPRHSARHSPLRTARSRTTPISTRQ